MSKRFLARAMAGTLTVALLLTGLCGCGKDADTPAPTDATTTASDTTTTAPEETTAPPTDATTTPDTSATDAPTTAPTSEPTKVPTKLSAPAYQIGSDRFVLDGEVFTLGGSPDALFAHFGKPHKVEHYIDPIYAGDMHFYYYDNAIMETQTLLLDNGQRPEIVRGIAFSNDHYSFEGVKVGMTVGEVDAVIGTHVEGVTNYFQWYEGVNYGLYRKYPAKEKQNGICWMIFYVDPNGGSTDTLDGGSYHIPENFQVGSIELRYDLKDFFDTYRGQWNEDKPEAGCDPAFYPDGESYSCETF